MTRNPAQVYQEDFVPMLFAPWVGDLLDAAGAKPGDRGLDVACGTGVVTRELAKRVGETGFVAGFDFAPPMIDVARTIPIEGATVEWHVADVMDLPFDNDVFDVAVCQQGFQFFPDKVSAARELHRVLKPGGTVAIAVWAGLDQHRLYDEFNKASIRHIGQPVAAMPFSYNDDGQFQADLEAAGFTNVAIVTLKKDVFYRPVETYIDMQVEAAAAVLPLLKEMSSDQRAELTELMRADVQPIIDQHTVDGMLVLPTTNRIATATA